MDIEKRNEEIIAAFRAAGATGKGIVFDVLDTGITPVGDLVGHVQNMTPEYPVDTAGHGTMVAYLIKNALPDAEIRSYCAIPEGMGTHKTIQTCLEHVLKMVKQEPEKQHIVNMSLSGKYSLHSPETKALEAVINELTALNVQVVCAAGNDGKEVPNAVPGCFEAPYTASAIDRQMKHADFSTLHGEVDFAEHGKDVYTKNAQNNWVRASGTSFACPNLAAKIGLLQSAHKNAVGKWLTDEEVYQALLDDTQDLGKTGRDPIYGWGYVDLKVKEENYDMGIIDTGLSWPNGIGNVRSKTDHVQIHHTVGNYGAPEKWEELHRKKQKDGQRGVPYSFLVLQDGSVYLGRGWSYSHGAVKDAITDNANQRSVAIALDGDMRKDALPTKAQLASAVALCREAMKRYGLSAKDIIGHNEVPLEDGGTYPTECPSMDMDEFRKMVGGEEPTPQPTPAPVPAPTGFPYYARYAGSTYVNLRDEPGGKAVGRVAKGERVVVLRSRNTTRKWVEVIVLTDIPQRGWCVPDWLERE